MEEYMRLIIMSDNIHRLTAADFNMEQKAKISLKYDDCMLVLFHVENKESYQMAQIWTAVARQIAGPIFASINLLTEKKVVEAFTQLKSDGSNPLHWAALRQFPFILVYRQGWPVAVYNGPREVQAIIDYALTLACEAGYYEPMQIGGSMQADERIEMGPYKPYVNIPSSDGTPQQNVIRKDSLQYSATNPIRGFDATIGIVTPGSAASQAALQRITQEETMPNTGVNTLTGESRVQSAPYKPPAAVAVPVERK